MLRRKRSRAMPALLLALLGRRRSRSRPPLPAVLGALAALVAGAGAALLRRRRAGGGGDDVRAAPGSPPSQVPATKAVHQEWTCQCGQQYRVSGEGRHRIYWLPDAPISDPITEGRCANCERELPGDQVSAADGDSGRPAPAGEMPGAGGGEVPGDGGGQAPGGGTDALATEGAAQHHGADDGDDRGEEGRA
jgi:hypothetical protein